MSAATRPQDGKAQDAYRLVARPIAHRGLHDVRRGVIENTATAFVAAMTGHYGIELDVQVSNDGEAMVHHDDALGRLADGDELLRSLSSRMLRQVHYKGTSDTMMTLGDALDLVGGRTALLVEIKSRFDGDMRLAGRIAAVLKNYRGPIGVMSFDPAPIIALRRLAPRLIRGIVAERRYDGPHWAFLAKEKRRELAFLLHGWKSRPAFLAYRVSDLSAIAPQAARHMFGWPVLAWTVRTEQDRAMATRLADQMIFEGFRA